MMGGDEQFEWQAILTKYYLNLALHRQIFGALIQIVVSWTENRHSQISAITYFVNTSKV